MRISQILALAIISVTGSMAVAQTYTGTAGTDGGATVSSDYAEATGDGASVAVDVPLEFILPKNIAIAVSPDGTKTLPANTLFDGIIPLYESNSYGLLPDNITTNNQNTKEDFDTVISGGIYANSSINVTAETTDYLHESDPNSIIKSRSAFHIGITVPTNNAESEAYGDIHDDDNSATTVFPGTIAVDDTELAASGNKVSFLFWQHPYADTIEPTDRAGKYLSTTTITVVVL